MRNILLTISYDGTSFCGWQRQDKSDKELPVRTVQGEIEHALEKLHGEHITLYGSGRTDSGVHAAAQAANFISPIDTIPVERYPAALNSFLPQDVRIMKAFLVAEKFNSRFDATSRVYRYFMFTGNIPSASQIRYVWPVKYTPDIEKLNAMASCLRGELDCASFTASGDKSLSTCRYLECAHFFVQNAFPCGNLIVFEIEANAFLWKMVRSITGTLIQLEKKGADAEDFKNILNARDRRCAGITAPPQGLFLWEVKFNGVRRHI
ncbi:MAG: tRNA pseudouridine(38-40) synthase TruA [Treponema sp.]|nr:tRNA pseudouridine(38-40) synthase TruA [Treponema sp.]